MYPKQDNPQLLLLDSHLIPGKHEKSLCEMLKPTRLEPRLVAKKGGASGELLRHIRFKHSLESNCSICAQEMRSRAVVVGPEVRCLISAKSIKSKSY